MSTDAEPPPRRNRAGAARDKHALDQIAAILATPLTCTRAELAAHDRDALAQIAGFVEASGRGC